MTASLTHKRGNTLVLTGEVRVDGKLQELQGWSIRAQVRKKDLLVETLTVTKSEEFMGLYVLTSAPSTALWPLGDLCFDVEYTNTVGQIVSTETVTFHCVAEVTK
jgi:hypothetical protein